MSRADLDATRQTWLNKLGPYGLYIIVGLILVLLPSFTSPNFQDMMAKAIIFAIFALSLNLLVGYTGLFSLGHAAFFGVGGYTAGILIVRYGIHSFWLLRLAS